MYRVRLLSGFAIGLAFLASLILGGSVLAQETKREVQLTPSRDSGVSGTAVLTDVPGGVEIELDMENLPEAGVKHINHIHGGGTCAEERAGNTAPVTIPLKTVVAQEDGTGSATTTIEDVTLAELFGNDQDRFILFHAKAKKGQGVPPGIACADLVSSLPETGGVPPMVVLLAGTAVLGLGTAAGLFALLRRNA